MTEKRFLLFLSPSDLLCQTEIVRNLVRKIANFFFPLRVQPCGKIVFNFINQFYFGFSSQQIEHIWIYFICRDIEVKTAISIFLEIISLFLLRIVNIRVIYHPWAVSDFPCICCKPFLWNALQRSIVETDNS